MPDRDQLPVPRRELAAPYHHPFRLAARHVWRTQPVLRGQSKLAAALAVGGGLAAVVLSPLLALLAAVGGMLAIFDGLVLGWMTAADGLRIRRVWSEKSEPRTIRERRPHAGARDPDLAHDEFAVGVEDDGYLVTWRFRPLAIDEHTREDEVEVQGRPRYGASPVGQQPFARADAAAAAEQLFDAQERAAALEEAAADAAREGVEHALETRSTAAALQSATGQDADRGRGRRLGR